MAMVRRYQIFRKEKFLLLFTDRHELPPSALLLEEGVGVADGRRYKSEFLEMPNKLRERTFPFLGAVLSLIR